MDGADIRALRMKAHGLTAEAASTATEAVSRLLAVQAQNLHDASWAIGLRVPETTGASIAEDIAQGALVRTWTMRGTLHLVNASDVRWLLSLAAPRARATRSSTWRQLQLDEGIFERAREIAVGSLSGGQVLSRTALLAAFAEGAIAANGGRGSHIIRYLAESCTIIPGPPSGTTPTFALFDHWVAPSPEISRDECLHRLATRYIQGHGPATVRDLAWWSGLTIGDARRAFDIADEELASFVFESNTYRVWPELIDHTVKRDIERPAVHLIPGFDEYHIGYETRRHILDDSYRHAVGPAKNGLFKNPLLIDGGIEGIWSPTLERKSLTLEVNPFGSKALNPRALERALEPSRVRYERFEGRATEVRVRSLSSQT